MELQKRVKSPLNKETKVVAGNFLSLFLLKGIDFLIPLLTLPYLLRIIGSDGYGQIMFALALINYFIGFAYYGFNLTGTRFVELTRGLRCACSISIRWLTRQGCFYALFRRYSLLCWSLVFLRLESTLFSICYLHR